MHTIRHAGISNNHKKHIDWFKQSTILTDCVFLTVFMGLLLCLCNKPSELHVKMDSPIITSHCTLCLDYFKFDCSWFILYHWFLWTTHKIIHNLQQTQCPNYIHRQLLSRHCNATLNIGITYCIQNASTTAWARWVSPPYIHPSVSPEVAQLVVP